MDILLKNFKAIDLLIAHISLSGHRIMNYVSSQPNIDHDEYNTML